MAKTSLPIKSQSKTTSPVDPYQRFEQTKLKNFQHSSRLEGIEPVTVATSLEAVLAKYKRG